MMVVVVLFAVARRNFWEEYADAGLIALGLVDVMFTFHPDRYSLYRLWMCEDVSTCMNASAALWIARLKDARCTRLIEATSSLAQLLPFFPAQENATVGAKLVVVVSLQIGYRLTPFASCYDSSLGRLTHRSIRGSLFAFASTGPSNERERAESAHVPSIAVRLSHATANNAQAPRGVQLLLTLETHVMLSATIGRAAYT
jgi:hypothetical protein